MALKEGKKEGGTGWGLLLGYRRWAAEVLHCCVPTAG